jgi:hypothetical protein
LLGLAILVAGFWFLRFISNLQRIAPRPAEATASATPSPSAPVARLVAPRAEPVESPTALPQIAAATTTTPPAVTATLAVPVATPVPTAVAVATPTIPVARAVEPEVRRAVPVRPEELAAAQAENATADTNAPNRVDIKPLRKTYMRVTIDDDPSKPAFERWVSPSDGTVEFRGHRFSVTVLDRDAVQIRKNGKVVSNSDTDLRISAQ